MRSGLFGIEALVREPNLSGDRRPWLTRSRGDRRRDGEVVDHPVAGKRARDHEAKRRATELPRSG
jgi:hypothetical protein